VNASYGTRIIHLRDGWIEGAVAVNRGKDLRRSLAPASGPRIRILHQLVSARLADFHQYISTASGSQIERSCWLRRFAVKGDSVHSDLIHWLVGVAGVNQR